MSDQTTKPFSDWQNISPEDEARVARDLPAKIKRLESGSITNAISELIDGVKLLFAMLRDKSFSMRFRTRAVIVGALLYFVLPADLTPDYIPVVGYVDDAAVIGTLLRLLRSEIELYKSSKL